MRMENCWLMMCWWTTENEWLPSCPWPSQGFGKTELTISSWDGFHHQEPSPPRTVSTRQWLYMPSPWPGVWHWAEKSNQPLEIQKLLIREHSNVRVDVSILVHRTQIISYTDTTHTHTHTHTQMAANFPQGLWLLPLVSKLLLEYT